MRAGLMAPVESEGLHCTCAIRHPETVEDKARVAEAIAVACRSGQVDLAVQLLNRLTTICWTRKAASR